MRMSNTKLDSEAFLERTLKKMDDCDYETALKDINIGIELDQNDPGLLYGRGHIKICLEDYEGAIEDLSSAIKLDSSEPVYFFYRGLANKELLNYNGANIPIIIGKGMAAYTKLELGDTFTIRWMDNSKTYDAAEGEIIHIMDSGNFKIDMESEGMSQRHVHLV